MSEILAIKTHIARWLNSHITPEMRAMQNDPTSTYSADSFTTRIILDHNDGYDRYIIVELYELNEPPSTVIARFTRHDDTTPWTLLSLTHEFDGNTSLVVS
jgi:hypothetical protein